MCLRVSLVLLVSCSHVRDSPGWRAHESSRKQMGHSRSQKWWEAEGRLETARIQDFWVGLGLPPPWVERFSKLQLKGPTKRAKEGVLTLLP